MTVNAAAEMAEVTRRVAAAARGSARPVTRRTTTQSDVGSGLSRNLRCGFRITTRTASVVVMNSNANGMATAHATSTDAPAAIVNGTATPANAIAAAVSPYQDFSRPRTIARASSRPGMTGTANDQRTAGSTTRAAPAPARIASASKP